MRTRTPSGLPSWPILLIAGVEKAGKSFACAEASASDLIGRTFWIGCGEDDPDELASIPGARFEIVEHDGTYSSLLAAVHEASQEPAEDGRPNMIVFDSMTRLWDLLKDEAQVIANRRASAKGRKKADDEAQITMDLWNRAKGRWADVIAAFRAHKGPVLLTARLEKTAIVNGRGEPTKDKDWKIQAEKTLVFDVGAIVELPEYGQAYLTGIRSLRYQRPPGEKTPYPGFTVSKLWADLGVGADAATDRKHHGSTGAVSVQAEDGGLLNTAKQRVWQAHKGSHPNLADADRRDAITELIAGRQLNPDSADDLNRLAGELSMADPWAERGAA